VASRYVTRPGLGTRPRRPQDAPHGGNGTGREGKESELTTREPSRDLSGVRLALGAVVRAGLPGWGDPLPMATPTSRYAPKK